MPTDPAPLPAPLPVPPGAEALARALQQEFAELPGAVAVDGEAVVLTLPEPRPSAARAAAERDESPLLSSAGIPLRAVLAPSGPRQYRLRIGRAAEGRSDTTQRSATSWSRQIRRGSYRGTSASMVFRRTPDGSWGRAEDGVDDTGVVRDRIRAAAARAGWAEAPGSPAGAAGGLQSPRLLIGLVVGAVVVIFGLAGGFIALVFAGIGGLSR